MESKKLDKQKQVTKPYDIVMCPLSNKVKGALQL